MAGAYIQQVDASTADRLFVTKIPLHATRDEVAAYFSRFGLTTDVYLPQAPGMGGHKGIAFVSFSDPGAVQLTITNGPHLIADHEVVVDIAAPRGAQPRNQAPVAAAMPFIEQSQPAMVQQAPEQASADRLFVTKVPPALQREHLREHFAQFGDLTDVYMPSVPGGGAHKGICFVSFSDPNALQFALQHPAHEVRGYPVVVDVAAPRGTVGPGAGAPRPQLSAAPQPQLGGQAYGFSTMPAAVPAAVPAMPMATPVQQVATGFSGTMGASTAVGNLGGFAAGGFGAAAPAPAPTGQAMGTPVPGRLFVTRVTPDMSKVDLQLYFQQFGELEDVYIPMNGKGIAFVSFRDAAVSQRVLQSQQHFVKPGKAVVVGQAKDRPPLGGKGGGNAPAGFGITRTSVVGQAAQPTRFSPY